MKIMDMQMIASLNRMRRNSVRLAICTAMLGIPLIIGCQQTASVNGGWSQKTGIYIQGTYTLVWDPPGSYLSQFNASQALLNISMSNAELTSAGGTATVSVIDLSTGQTVGQQSFGYVVSGSSVYAQNPTSVQNWLNQFTGYANVDVDVQVNDLAGQNTASSGTASATASAQYQGTTYASTTATWDVGGGDGSCPHSPCYIPPNQ